MSLQELLQQIVNGLVVGAVYGLVALGYTMVYGIVRLINFAQGALFEAGAYVGVVIFSLLGTFATHQPLVGLLIAVIGSALLTGGWRTWWSASPTGRSETLPRWLRWSARWRPSF